MAGTLALVLTALAFKLAAYPLLDPDEGRNAEIAREMYHQGDWLVPHLNGAPYVDKPVLYFAAGAALMHLFGPTVWAARLTSLLFTFATLTLVWTWARPRLTPAGAVVAVLATATTPLTLAFARTVIFDAALTTFVVLALIAFQTAIDRFDPDRPTATGWWSALAWTAIAFGVLTKGPIALGIPLMVAIPYAAYRHRFRPIVDIVGPLIFVALLLPWLLVMSRTAPGHLHYAIVTETLRRFSTTELHRTGPWWYFLPILAAGSLPWLPIGLAEAWHRRGRPADHDRVFLLLWIVIPLLFFSLSQSKRPQYVLPLIPPIALLAARMLSGDSRRAGTAMSAAGVGLMVVGGILGSAPWTVPALLDVSTEVGSAIPQVAAWLGGVSTAAGLAVVLLHRRIHVAAMILAVPVASIPLVATPLLQTIGLDRSAESLAAAIANRVGSHTPVIGVHAFPLSLPFYLRRTITVVTDDGHELTSNYLRRNLERWSGPGTGIRRGDWWREALRKCHNETVFVARADDLAVRSTLEQTLPFLAGGGRYVAYGPCVTSRLARRAQ